MDIKIYIVVRNYDESSHNEFVTTDETRAINYASASTKLDNGSDYVVQEWKNEELIGLIEFYMDNGVLKKAERFLY